MSMIGQISPFLKTTSQPVYSAFNGTVRKTYNYPDNRVLAIGQFTQYGSTTVNGIVRLNTDGTIDNTFDTGTGFRDFGNAAVLNALGVVDNSILIVGRFTTYNGTAANRIIRLNDDGSIDTRFAYGSGFSGSGINTVNADAVTVINDSSYLVGGNFTDYNGDSSRGLVIILRGGARDTNFDIGTGINVGQSTIGVRSVGFDNQSRVLVGGDYVNITSISILRIGRLSTTGSLDTSFTNGNGFSGGHALNSCYSIIPVSDGYYCGGQFGLFKGTLANRLTKITLNGQLDPTFNIGTGFNAAAGSVLTIALDSRANLYCGGSFTLFQSQTFIRMIKLTSAGNVIDATFDISSGGLNGTVWHINYIDDDRIIIAGDFTSYKGKETSRLIIINSKGNLVS